MNITDEQGVKWLLLQVYRAKYRYIAMDKDGKLFAFVCTPVKYKNTWKCLNGDYDEIPDYLRELINQLVSWEDKEPLDIGKYLGIVDWENVPVDTKVFVSDDGRNWERRHFKCYDKENNKGKCVCFADGRTSWSNKDNHEGIGWGYCKLAEGE